MLEETFGLSPSGWSYPSGEQLNVTVIAFDDKAVDYLRFYMSVNGNEWSTIPLHDLPVTEVLGKLREYYDELSSNVSKLLETLTSLRVGINISYKFTLPALKLKYVMIPAQKAGSYVLFKAEVSDGNQSSVTPTSLYYVYNKGAEKKVLIVDPNILVWLTKYNVKTYGELIRSKYIGGLPIVSDYVSKLYTNDKVKQLTKLVNLLQPFHHWEYLGTEFQVSIVTNISKLSSELQECKPDIIVLSNLWLGLNLTNSPLFNWDLLDLKQVSDLINYVKENHAGLIVTHATLSDLIIWVSGEGKVKVMPRGHVGYTLRDVSIIDEKTVAGCTGLGMLPIYEYVRDKVAEYLIELSLPYLGVAIGSTPLLVPWVPWNGSLVETNATSLLGWTIPREPIEIPSPYSKLDPNVKAYTLVGWQLGSPVTQVEVFMQSARYVADVAKRYYAELNAVIANITGKSLEVHSVFRDSLAGNISFVYGMFANASMVGVEGLTNISIGEVVVPVNVTLPRKAIEQLLILVPVKLVAVSPDGLAGIVTYDRYWDQDAGFRAVYFSFEVEAGVNEAAKQLLLKAVNWTLKWKPVSVVETLRNVTKAVVQEVGTKAEELLRNVTALAYNVTVATRKGGVVEHVLEPGVYYILIKSVGDVSPNITGVVIEEVKNITPTIKLVTVKTNETSKLKLTLHGENRPAIILFFKEVVKRVEETFAKLQEKTKKALETVPGKLEFNKTVTFKGMEDFKVPITREKAYVVMAYNGTLNINVSGRAVIEELEPGLYVIAVYIGKSGEVSLRLETSNITKISVSISVKATSPADFNNDNTVDYRDLAVLARAYGSSKGAKTYSIVADVNCDGIIDYRDLAILAAKYGERVG